MTLFSSNIAYRRCLAATQAGCVAHHYDSVCIMRVQIAPEFARPLRLVEDPRRGVVCQNLTEVRSVFACVCVFSVHVWGHDCRRMSARLSVIVLLLLQPFRDPQACNALYAICCVLYCVS